MRAESRGRTKRQRLENATPRPWEHAEVRRAWGGREGSGWQQRPGKQGRGGGSDSGT
jgi:hypothetical protein